MGPELNTTGSIYIYIYNCAGAFASRGGFCQHDQEPYTRITRKNPFPPPPETDFSKSSGQKKDTRKSKEHAKKGFLFLHFGSRGPRLCRTERVGRATLMQQNGLGTAETRLFDDHFLV